MANPERTHEPRKLTKKGVDALDIETDDYRVWDTENRGFGVKVLAPTKRYLVGRKVYLLKYRTKDGTAGKLDIGTHGEITADQARKIALGWKVIIAEGGDPKAQRDELRRVRLDPASRFEKVVERFIKQYAQPRQRTWKETERTLLVNCAAWKSRSISSITKTDAYDLLDGFIAAGHEAKARVTLAWLKTLFRWCVKRDVLKASIMEAVDIETQRKVRTRFYKDAEIKAVWSAAGRLERSEGGFVKLCLLLAVRKSELAGMRRSEFDDAEKPTLWTIPHKRTKTRKSVARERVYIVPLPGLAQRIIKSLPKSDDDLLFPGSRESEPFVPGSALSALVREKSKVADWTYHACRDTAATWLKDQGHSKYERELVLNHAESGVTGEYSHGYPVELKRSLMEKWAAHVAGLVQPEGAVLLS